MAELNPTIRNAIYTAWLAILRAGDGDEEAKEWVGWLYSMIPSYWEEPELTRDNPWRLKEFLEGQQDFLSDLGEKE